MLRFPIEARVDLHFALFEPRGRLKWKFKSVGLFAENTFYWLPMEDDETQNFLRTGFAAAFTDAIGVELSYKTGQTAPVFKSIDVFQANLTVQF